MTKLIPKYLTAWSPVLPLSAFNDRTSSTDNRSDHLKSKEDAILTLLAAAALRVLLARVKADERNKRNERLRTYVNVTEEGEPEVTTLYNVNNNGTGLESAGPEKWFLEYLLAKPLFQGVGLISKYAGAKYGGLSAFGHWSRNNLLANDRNLWSLTPKVSYSSITGSRNVLKDSKKPEYIKFANTIGSDNYSWLKRHPRFTADRNFVHSLDYPNGVDVLGELLAAPFNIAYALEMKRRAGKTPFLFDREGNITSFENFVDKAVKKPITVVNDAAGDYNGLFFIKSANPYLNIYASDPASTAFHETVMHGTDHAAEAIGGNSFYVLNDLANKIKDKGFTTASKNSSDWKELRATMGQAIRSLYRSVSKASGKGINIEEMRPSFEKGVDKLSLEDVARTLDGINAYGEDYAAFLRLNPEHLEDFKWLLKNMVSVSPAATLLLKTNENKSR